jgi:hypothetical protein
MPRVQIHCYGCDATVAVATSRSTEDLDRAGWSLIQGETYCPQCAPARVPAGVAAKGSGEEVADADGADGDGSLDPGPAASAARSPEAARASSASATGRAPGRRSAAAVAASIAGAVRLPGFVQRLREHDAEAHLERLRHVATAVVAVVRLPFRRPRARVTSHSKVTTQTIVLFCLAAVLTLTTLGSNELAVRLPGVVFAFAAGVSWLHDLRERA